MYVRIIAWPPFGYWCRPVLCVYCCQSLLRSRSRHPRVRPVRVAEAVRTRRCVAVGGRCCVFVGGDGILRLLRNRSRQPRVIPVRVTEAVVTRSCVGVRCYIFGGRNSSNTRGAKSDMAAAAAGGSGVAVPSLSVGSVSVS
jgi:hypothetical protein